MTWVLASYIFHSSRLANSDVRFALRSLPRLPQRRCCCTAMSFFICSEPIEALYLSASHCSSFTSSRKPMFSVSAIFSGVKWRVTCDFSLVIPVNWKSLSRTRRLHSDAKRRASLTNGISSDSQLLAFFCCVLSFSFSEFSYRMQVSNFPETSDEMSSSSGSFLFCFCFFCHWKMLLLCLQLCCCVLGKTTLRDRSVLESGWNLNNVGRCVRFAAQAACKSLRNRCVLRSLLRDQRLILVSCSSHQLSRLLFLSRTSEPRRPLAECYFPVCA